MKKTVVIYHSADFDGIFCREIARKFLGNENVEYVGWDFKDAPLDAAMLHDSRLVIMDLPIGQTFGLQFKDGWICRGEEQIQPIDRWDSGNITWIDHHASSIATHPTNIPGYRLDGVSACRLAWFYFTALERYTAQTTTADFTWFQGHYPWATKQDFINRALIEPLAVRLAGEYDIWDKRDPRAELFQHGLRSQELTNGVWSRLLSTGEKMSVSEIEALIDVGHKPDLRPDGTVDNSVGMVEQLLRQGEALQYARQRENESIIKEMGFTFEWEGLKFLACNHARYNSLLFTAGVRPEHDALFGFKFIGHCAGGIPCEEWSISLYHAPGKEQHDLSKIAVKYGGGGHRGACGFKVNKLPFLS